MRKILAILIANLLFGVDYEVVQSKNINGSKEYVGNIYSTKESAISTRVMGYLKSIQVEEGDFVKKGDLLFEVDPSDIESAINEAKANLQKAKANLTIAKLDLEDGKRDFERYENLLKKEVVAKVDYDKSKLNMELKKAKLNLAQSMVDEANINLERANSNIKYSKVIAGFDGVVVAKKKNISELVSAGEPVLIISSIDGIKAKALIQESEISNLKISQKVNIEIEALNKKIDGSIISIVPFVDVQTHSYIVKFKLDNIENLIPGMYAKILVESKNTKEALLVPINSITQRAGINGVFVLNSDSTISFKKVETLNKFADYVEVSGVKKGDKVILYPKRNLEDGQKIEQ